VGGVGLSNWTLGVGGWGGDDGGEA
jgi:hypothetical protein